MLMVKQYETISPQILRTDEHKLKATIAFLPYAARQEENGSGELPNTSFCDVGLSQPSL